MTADVTIEPAGTSTVHLPLRYDPVAPSSWTLTVAAHVEEQRTGLDREASFTKTFTTRPTCGCAVGTKGAFYAGDGSGGSPFRVATPDQLNHVRVHNERCYRQIADLDFAGWGDFAPIWPNASLLSLIHIFFRKGLVNSIKAAFLSLLLGIPFAVSFAYPLARIKFKGVKLIRDILLFTMAIPVFATIIPLYRLFVSLQLLDNLFGLVLEMCIRDSPLLGQ